MVAGVGRGRGQAQACTDEGRGTHGSFHREYLLAAIDRHLFWLDQAGWPSRSPDFYFDWMSDSLAPAPYVTLDYAPLAERLRAYTRYASNIPRAVAQIRANLRMPMARTVLQYGIDSFGGLAEYYRNDVPGVFAPVAEAALQAAFAEANGGASHAGTHGLAAVQAR